MQSKARRVVARFWAKVKKGTGCWLWTGATSSYGYGKLHIRKSTVDAHRISWEVANGIIPLGMSVLHRCDNPLCVRPSHLFLGTHRENMQDKTQKGRGLFGERNGRCKLTPKDVRFIRSSPLAATSLRRMFCVSDGTIRDIRAGRSWRHLLGKEARS
jgi:hypothetical protein